MNGTVDPCATPPIANAGNDVTIENGGNTQLNASGGETYSWSPTTGLSDTTIANPVASPTNDITYMVTVTDSNGCTATVEVAVSVTTENEVDIDTTLSIHPNPVTDMVTISYTSSREIMAISLFDILGRKVKTVSDQIFPAGEHELSFRVDMLLSGVYVLQLSDGQRIYTKKIVVTK